MQKIFLYIDESKNITARKLSLAVLVSKKRLWIMNNSYILLKEEHHFSWELHGYRKKEVQYFWKQLEWAKYWEHQNLIEKIYFIEFENFDERGYKWLQVYKYLNGIIWGIQQIYSDAITLSKIDTLNIKNQLLLRSANIEFLHSGNNSSIQMADILCGYCHHEGQSSLGNIQILRCKTVLSDQ